MENQSNKNVKNPFSVFSRQMAMLSIWTGTISLILCTSPDIHFGISVAGILLALYSKTGETLSSTARIGLVISLVSMILSLILFGLGYLTFALAESPEFSPVIRGIIIEFQQLLEQQQMSH